MGLSRGFTFLAVVGVTLGSGCIRRESAPDAAARPRWLRWAAESGAVCSSDSLRRHPVLPSHACLTGEGLARPAAEMGSGGATPALAEGWTDEEATTWRITLRPDVRWSDGVALSAAQVVESWKTVLAHCATYPPAQWLMGIVGARAFCEKRAPFDGVGIRAEGDRVVEVKLTAPTPWFAWLLAHPVLWPFRADHPTAGLGSFVTQHAPEVASDGEWRFMPNPRYTGEKPELDGIVVFRAPTAATLRVQAFLSGELDLITDLGEELRAPFRQDSRLKAFPSTQLALLVFNTFRRPTDDLALRKALLQAIDPDEMIQLHGWPHRRFYGLLDFERGAAAPSWALSFSATAARRTLAALGFGGASAVPAPVKAVTLRLATDTPGALARDIADNLRAQWQKNLGVRWEEGPSAQASAAIVFHDADPFQPPADWRRFQGLLDRWGRWRNRPFDAEMEKAAAAKSAAEARAHLDAASRILLQSEAVAMPLFVRARHALVGARVTGISRDVLGHWDFRKVRLD